MPVVPCQTEVCIIFRCLKYPHSKREVRKFIGKFSPWATARLVFCTSGPGRYNNRDGVPDAKLPKSCGDPAPCRFPTIHRIVGTTTRFISDGSHSWRNMKNIEELKCKLQFTAFCMKLTMGSRDGSKTPSTYEYKIIARPGKDFGAGTQNTHHACTITPLGKQVGKSRKHISEVAWIRAILELRVYIQRGMGPAFGMVLCTCTL